MKRRVLILRPEPRASVTAAKAAALGIEAIVRPLFETRAVEWVAPDAGKFDAIVMTSASAPLHGGAGLAGYLEMPLYAVGKATAAAAQAAGFENVFSGSADAAAILATMARAGCGNALHLAGRDRTELGIETVTVYASEMLCAPEIPDSVVALLHSTRAALRFAELATTKSSVAIVAISRAVADAAGPGWQSVAVADQPRDAAMLALAARLCETREE